MLDNLLLPVHPDNYPEESDEGETETTAPAADGDGDKAAEDGKGVGENGKKKKKDGGEKATGGTKTTGGKVAGGTKEEVVKTTEDGAIVTKPGPIVRTLADWCDVALEIVGVLGLIWGIGMSEAQG